MRGVGLATAPMECAGICARSLLVEDRDGHDIRSASLIALIGILLQYGRHVGALEPDGVLQRQAPENPDR